MADIQLYLTDNAIAKLPAPIDGRYLARDNKLKGFFVVVGKRKRTFCIQTTLRMVGRRAPAVKVFIGDARTVSTRVARSIAKEYLARISGEYPDAETRGACLIEEATWTAPTKQTTLKQAWDRYRESHLVRKGRSEKTIKGYRDHVERLFADWLGRPLRALAEHPTRVASKHDDITKTYGPYMANGAMRTLRAIYNHARKTDRSLPRENPASAVDWNEERRRDSGMGPKELLPWLIQLSMLENPLRRELHLLTLLSGSRSSALQAVRLVDIDFRRRVMHIPRPKGGPTRAFDVPLSREMIWCLVRAIRFGREMYPAQSADWLFPADSASGHVTEIKENRSKLSKWGNDLRQTFRNFAAVAGISEIDAKLLMNHSVPGVNAGYITRQKLVEGHLRRQQQRISSAIFAEFRGLRGEHQGVRVWLGRRVGRCE